MESSFKLTLSSPCDNILLRSCFLIFLLPSCQSVSDYTTLIYKNCANKTHMATADSFSQALSSLFQALIEQSSKSNFFKETAGDNEIFLSGLFQCRGDISRKDCRNCVTQLEQLSNSLCTEAVSARVHLQGCYMHYEIDGDGIPETSKRHLLHKVCGATETISGAFDEARDAAFAALEDGIARSVNGFYETRYESVQVMAQCQGDLWGCDCAECVGSAVQIAQTECSGSATGQVYLDNCYMSFTCYPGGKGDKNSDSGGKLVAIVLGGAATLGLGFILLVFCKSCGKRDDDYI